MGGESARTTVPKPEPRFNFKRSLSNVRFGLYDPSASLDRKRVEKVFFGSSGLVHAVAEEHDDGVELHITGPGAEGELRRWSELWPPQDRYAEFHTDHPLVNRLHRSLPGLRMLRQPWLFEVACHCVLQQRVTWQEALRSWRRLVKGLGQPHAGMTAFPSPAVLARVSPHSLNRFDIDFHRAKAIVGLARAHLSDPLFETTTSFGTLRDRLPRIPGIGPWTTEMVLGVGAADPDALPTGDLKLPHVVSWALAGEARGDDERMLELMEPFSGHRFRVYRLLMAGKVKAPRFAPKKPVRPPRW